LPIFYQAFLSNQKGFFFARYFPPITLTPHLFPFRTEQLSPPAVMVRRGGKPGRVSLPAVAPREGWSLPIFYQAFLSNQKGFFCL
jgi:hypothetical protein